MAQSPMLRMSEPRGTGGELTWSSKNGAKTRVGQSDGIIVWDIHIWVDIYIYQTNRTTGSFNGAAFETCDFRFFYLKR